MSAVAQQKFSVVRFPVHGDDRGSLIALETAQEIPFLVRRVYYIYGTQPGVSRGFHAHRRLNQLCVALSGTVRFVLDDGACQQSVTLDSPEMGLHIGPGLWREMHEFSPDCVLMVLADRHYEADDYIRDHAAFMAEFGKEASR